MPCLHFRILLVVAFQMAVLAPAWAQTTTADDDGRVLPSSAEAALKQAEAAYEYGDMPVLVESARVVTDGTLKATDEQRAQALRLLGIGLYVTGRIPGAQTAFEQLMQLAPQTQLNPATTRPEIVTFFYQIRRARIEQLRQAHEASQPSAVFSFLPPVGQFQNGHHTKGWVLGVLEATTLITATTSYFVANRWRQGDGTACKTGLSKEACQSRTDRYNTIRNIERASWGAFALTYAFGVIDAMINRNHQPTEEELLKRSLPRVEVALLPHGAALSLRF